MAPSLLTRPPSGSRCLGLALLLSLALPAAHASSASCLQGDPRDADFQKRTEMERCEGIRRTKPIAADGLRLTSYTIGQAKLQRGSLGGTVFILQIPVSPAGLPEPEVAVEASKSNYLMTPLRFAPPKQGWKAFTWGAAVIQGQKIEGEQLRATARLRPSGDANQWLPVRFAPAAGYSLVISGNASLPITTVRIVRPDDRIVAQCPAPARIEHDLVCTWKAADLPSGTYLLRARDESGKTVLNVTLRHDPRWLSR